MCQTAKFQMNIDGWDKLPDGIVEKILLQAISSTNRMCKKCNNFMNACLEIIRRRCGNKNLWFNENFKLKKFQVECA